MGLNTVTATQDFARAFSRSFDRVWVEVSGFGFRVWDLWVRLQCIGFGVKSLGFGVEGSWFRVYACDGLRAMV